MSGPNHNQADQAREDFCPTCGALTDEMCVTPAGNARADHRARKPVAVPARGEVSS